MKSWYKSKLVWLGLLTVASAALDAAFLDGATWRSIITAVLGAAIVALRAVTSEIIITPAIMGPKVPPAGPPAAGLVLGLALLLAGCLPSGQVDWSRVLKTAVVVGGEVVSALTCDDLRAAGADEAAVSLCRKGEAGAKALAGKAGALAGQLVNAGEVQMSDGSKIQVMALAPPTCELVPPPRPIGFTAPEPGQ
jgi:hypothetical protein